MIYKKICTGVSFNRGTPVLQIFARDQNLIKKCIEVEQMPMYFYMKEFDDIDENDMREIISIFNGYESLHGNPLQKVLVKHLKSIGMLGRKYHGYESDIRWDKNCILDLKVTNKFYISRSKIKSLDYRFQDEHNIPGLAHDVSIVCHDDVQQDNLVDVDIPLRVCCFDIEVAVDSKENLSLFIGEILCAVFYDSYTGQYTHVYSEGSEKELIIKMLSYFKEFNPDVITGWNVHFDVNWLMKKAEAYEIDLQNYITEGKSFIKEYTSKEGKFVREPILAGKVILDGKELYYKKTYTTEKLSSYSLKTVAIVEGFPEWEDLAGNIKKEWANNKFKVLEYCRLDVERTWGIIDKNKLIKGAEIISRISGCELSEVFWNSKIIDSMLYLYKGNKVLPNIVYGREKSNVKGAEVLQAVVGLHNNVAVFDGASLYPSIIGGLNISSETLVIDNQEIENNKDKLIHIKVGERTFYFWKKKYRNGLLSIVITELRKLREEVRENRKLATKIGDTEAFKTLNDEEKVLKGLLASVYGVMGFVSFRLFNEDCANAITGVARNLIYEMQKHIDSSESRIIYGDSVLGDTPIYVERNGNLEIVPIKSLVSESTAKEGTGTQMPKNIKVLSDNSLVELKSVHVHKVKKIGYRICTRKSYIEVTDDHSLVINNKKIKPSDLKIGDNIDIMDNVNLFRNDLEFSKDMAWVFGLYLAEGTCGFYNETIQWKIGNKNFKLLEKARDILYKEIGLQTKLNIYASNIEFAELKAIKNTRLFINYFQELCYRGGEKIVPSVILNSTKEVKMSFLDGLLDGDGHYDNFNSVEFIGQIHKSILAGVVYILDELNIEYSLKTRIDKPNFIMIRHILNSNDKRIRVKDEIKSIEKFEINEVVYDLSTENEHFRGGIGNILLHNTDSVFIRVNSVEDGFITMDKINELFAQYTKTLGTDEHIITVNYEKFFKWILFIKKGGNTEDAAKKKYIGFISGVQSGTREMKEVSDLYYKGFELRRSDTAKALKYIMKEFFKLMESGDWQLSISFLREEKKTFSKWTMKELAIPRTVNKEDANNPHARGLKYAKEHLGFEFDDDELPKLVFVEYQTKYPSTKEICFNDRHVIPEEFKVNYSVMFDKLFKTKFEPILEALNLDWDVSLEGQQTIEQWFT